MKTRSNENNKNSAAKKIIPAVGMLALSATMLSTSTYAWFTMNKEVQMTGLSMTAAVGEGMEIALAGISGSDTVDDPATRPGDSNKAWSSAVVVGDYYEKIGTLKPASSVNGTVLFDATNASDEGKKASGYKKLDKIEDYKTTVTKRPTLNTDGSVECDTAADSAGYYVDIPVHLRTNKKISGDDQTADVYCKMMIKPNTPDGIIPDGAKDDLYKAVRVTFLPAEATSGTIFAADKEYFTPTKAVAGDGALADVAVVTDFVSYPTDMNSVDKLTFTDGIGADSGLDIDLAAANEKYGYLDFTVRVWLEGESTSCFNDNAGQSWNIDLAFSLGEFDTATTSEGVGA